MLQLQDTARCCTEVRDRILVDRRPPHLPRTVTHVSTCNSPPLYTTSRLYSPKSPDDRSWKVTSRWISLSDSNLPVLFMRAIQWQPRDSIRYRQALWAGWHKWNTAEREVKKGKAFYEHRWDILASRIYISGAVYTVGRYRHIWEDNIKANLKTWE